MLLSLVEVMQALCNFPWNFFQFLAEKSARDRRGTGGLVRWGWVLSDYNCPRFPRLNATLLVYTRMPAVGFWGPVTSTIDCE